jgi:hypothetical protein
MSAGVDGRYSRLVMLARMLVSLAASWWSLMSRKGQVLGATAQREYS